MPIINCFSQLSYAEAGKKHSGQNIDCREPLEKHLLVHLRRNTLLYYSNISGLCLILQTSTSPYYPCFFFFSNCCFHSEGCYNSLHWTIVSVEKWLICPVWYVYAGLQSNFLLDFSLVSLESCWVWSLLWPSVYCGLLTWVSLILFWVLAHWRTSLCWLEKIDKINN